MRDWMNWLVLSVMIAIAVLVFWVAPKSSSSGGCLFCGRQRYEAWVFGVKIRDRVKANAASAWVDGMHPGHTNHIWGGSSTKRKGWGFGPTAVGCGGVGAGGIGQIHFLWRDFGEERARDVLAKYHAQLSTDRTELHRWLRTEFARFYPPKEDGTSAP